MNSHQGMLDVINYLASQPTMDRVAQFIALDVLADFEPRGALVSVFDSDGSVHAVGSFGLSSDVIRGLKRLSLWDHAPNVDAIRNGTPVVIRDENDLQVQYPGLSNHASLVYPTIVWPLRLGRERLGSIQVQFSRFVDETGVQEAFDAIAPVIALYVALTVNGSGQHEDGASTDSTSHSIADQAATTLTQRQLGILRLIAEGMTNPQIAARIGYSDSTVRQETMAIYRFLGASGRHDAVSLAAMRGLLQGNELPESSAV